jgi:hypothetical protein
MKPRAECRHETVRFGSGDFYLFCQSCGAGWATVTGFDEINPRAANQGIGATLSGEPRNSN